MFGFRNSDTISRRRVLAALGMSSVVGGMVNPVAMALAQTPSPAEQATCPAPDLEARDISFRESVAYVDLSPFGREKDCENCESWVSAKEGPCGGCVIMRGPVHVRGYCTEWAKL